MIVYDAGIIDDWSGWQTPEQFFKPPPFLTDMESFGRDWSDWSPLWEEAKRLAARIGWEGDIRQGPYVTVVPHAFEDTGDICPIIIGWKQDNNGTTFIASERFHLSWLEGCAMAVSI